MRITKVKLDNYVCFYGTQFELGPGINFVVGKNNAGKTALLDALSFAAKGEPHRSKATLPDRRGHALEPNVETHEIEVAFNGKEVTGLLGARDINLPIAPSHAFRQPPFHESQLSQYLEKVSCNNHLVRCYFTSADTPSYRIETFQHLRLETGDFYETVVARVGDGSSFMFVSGATGYISESEHQKEWESVRQAPPQYIYIFDAERAIQTNSSPHHHLALCSDASNLAQVLHTIKNVRSHLFHTRYMPSVRSIIPSIRDLLITISNDAETGNSVVNLQVAYYDPALEREDLAIPLGKCGTGVGQILAMLYVVITSEEPRVILIDEPNSFLHPGAVRKLLEIFQQYDQHQYIIATHSPTAIMSVKEKRILLVEREDMRSTVRSVDVNDNADLERALKSIGSRRSDNFGMDAVIWVEGKTDEMCFKLIMEANGGSPDGVQIQALVNTGDLESKKHATLALQIYHKMSGGIGIHPTALGFLFDGDKDGAHKKAQVENLAPFHYLQRQNFESYLLDYPDIISEEVGKETDSVATWIDDNKYKSRYYANGQVQCGEDYWPDYINGAKFIEALFGEVGGTDCLYNKVRHGASLTKRILRKHPEHFSDIVNLIKRMIE